MGKQSKTGKAWLVNLYRIGMGFQECVFHGLNDGGNVFFLDARIIYDKGVGLCCLPIKIVRKQVDFDSMFQKLLLYLIS